MKKDKAKTRENNNESYLVGLDTRKILENLVKELVDNLDVSKNIKTLNQCCSDLKDEIEEVKKHTDKVVEENRNMRNYLNENESKIEGYKGAMENYQKEIREYLNTTKELYDKIKEVKKYADKVVEGNRNMREYLNENESKIESYKRAMEDYQKEIREYLNTAKELYDRDEDTKKKIIEKMGDVERLLWTIQNYLKKPGIIRLFSRLKEEV